MNRILFTHKEAAGRQYIRLEDYRAIHIIKVLHGTPGQIIKVGIINGPYGNAEIVKVEAGLVEIRPTWHKTIPAAHTLSIMLALPRPKVIKRLWAPLASLGLKRIIIINAEKVERNYFDTHWLREDNYLPLLIEGLTQAGDTILPEVIIRRQFKPFIEDELAGMFPDTEKLLAHPYTETKITNIIPTDKKEILVAVGPEGGWNEYELKLLATHNFISVSVMNGRTLRTDVACISLLAIINEMNS